MDDRPRGKRARPRIGLRGMAILLVVLAALFAVVRPYLRESLGWLERYARVRLNERDLYRHVDAGRSIAEKFAGAVSSGRLDAARQLTTVEFQRRTSLSAFEASAAVSTLRRDPHELTRGVIDFSDSQGRFVSKYDLFCGPAGGARTRVRLVLTTESGQLKVDQVEIVEADSPQR